MEESSQSVSFLLSGILCCNFASSINDKVVFDLLKQVLLNGYWLLVNGY